MLDSARTWLCQHAPLLMILCLVGALIASEAARMRHVRAASDYRALWQREVAAHRLTITNNRMLDLETRLASIPRKDVPVEYQDRLADVRLRFDRIVRGQAGPVCPAPMRVQAPKPPARADEPPACPMSEAEAEEARAAMIRLAALQEWVRANVEGVKP